jgi:hypothetical protein
MNKKTFVNICVKFSETFAKHGSAKNFEKYDNLFREIGHFSGGEFRFNPIYEWPRMSCIFSDVCKTLYGI